MAMTNYLHVCERQDTDGNCACWPTPGQWVASVPGTVTWMETQESIDRSRVADLEDLVRKLKKRVKKLERK